jgi:type IV pilus assembly protein PilA
METNMTSIKSALERRLAAGKNNEGGFSLIELLVVVIIIGILAAIAIPIYIGVQNNAKDSATKSDLTNAKLAVVAYYSDQNAFPASIDSATLKNYGFTGTGVTASTTGTQAVTNFCLKATSGSGAVFYINQDGAPSTTKATNCA